MFCDIQIFGQILCFVGRLGYIHLTLAGVSIYVVDSCLGWPFSEMHHSLGMGEGGHELMRPNFQAC